jgi:hypothetical protein
VRVVSPPADAELYEIEDAPLTKDEDGGHLVNWARPQPGRSSYLNIDLLYKASRRIDAEEFDRLRVHFGVPRAGLRAARARQKPRAGVRNRARRA